MKLVVSKLPPSSCQYHNPYFRMLKLSKRKTLKTARRNKICLDYPGVHHVLRKPKNLRFARKPIVRVHLCKKSYLWHNNKSCNYVSLKNNKKMKIIGTSNCTPELLSPCVLPIPLLEFFLISLPLKTNARSTIPTLRQRQSPPSRLYWKKMFSSLA